MTSWFIIYTIMPIKDIAVDMTSHILFSIGSIQYIPTLIITIITSIILIYLSIKHKNHLKAIMPIISAVLLCFVIELSIIFTALHHGMYQTDMSWSDMIQNIQLSNSENILPDDLSNCLIIYYKFGCPDCNAVFKDETEMLKNIPNSNIYWVSTRSRQGKELIKLYPVQEVPAMLYIDNNKKGISRIIYKKEHGKSVIDTDAVNEILKIYNYANS